MSRAALIALSKLRMVTAALDPLRGLIALQSMYALQPGWLLNKHLTALSEPVYRRERQPKLGLFKDLQRKSYAGAYGSV
jgi:hypothetical protein